MFLFIGNFSWSLRINVSCWNCVLVCTLQSDKIFNDLSVGHEFIKPCTNFQITIFRSSNVCSLNLMCNQCFLFCFLPNCNMQLIIMYKIGFGFYNFYGLWMQFNLRLFSKFCVHYVIYIVATCIILLYLCVMYMHH